MNVRKNEDIDIDAVRSRLTYDPETGKFHHLLASGNRSTGDEAGSTSSYGYISINVGGRKYLAHRIAWVWMTGDQVNGFIDHINGNRSDNRWKNLRWASHASNAMNRVAARRNASGFKGVVQRGDRWSAYIKLNRRQFFLGSYETAAEAAAAYDGAARVLFGNFALPNSAMKDRAA